MPTGNLRDCTVLIVDDSADNLAFMAQGLKNLYHVKAAKSGEMALCILNQFDIDLILLDIVMPDMTGYDVIRAVRANHDKCNIPVVFLTGKNSPEDEKLGFELGAADYIHKPVSIPLLRSRVKTHLQNKRSKDILLDQNGYLESQVVKRSSELIECRMRWCLRSLVWRKLVTQKRATISCALNIMSSSWLKSWPKSPITATS